MDEIIIDNLNYDNIIQNLCLNIKSIVKNFVIGLMNI